MFSGFSSGSFASDQKPVFNFPSTNYTPNLVNFIPEQTQTAPLHTSLSLQALNDTAQLKEKIKIFLSIFDNNLMQRIDQYEVIINEQQAKDFEAMCKLVNSSQTDRINYHITNLGNRFKINFEHRSIPLPLFARKT